MGNWIPPFPTSDDEATKPEAKRAAGYLVRCCPKKPNGWLEVGFSKIHHDSSVMVSGWVGGGVWTPEISSVYSFWGGLAMASI